jgi:hypothetical protein
MEIILKPNNEYDFTSVILLKPTIISGGNFFIRYLKNENPVYIQPPKCIIRNGINKSGRRLYCDLLFSNENAHFIQWIENLENISRNGIFANREKWFETDLEMHDVENYFVSPLKFIKSGKNCILRVYIQSAFGNCDAKIFNESGEEITMDELNEHGENMNVETILEFQGIKCSSHSFSIETEIKQILLLKPTELFNTCRLVRPNTQGTAQENIASENHVENQTELLEDTHGGDIILGMNSIIIPEIQLCDLQENSNNEETTVPIENPSFSNDQEPKITTSVENKENNEIICNNDHLYSDILEEIDLQIDENDGNDVIKIKEKGDVYYDLYMDALNKATISRKKSITNYLETKYKIVNAYLLFENDDSK